jgi:hypothetical protein
MHEATKLNAKLYSSVPESQHSHLNIIQFEIQQEKKFCELSNQGQFPVFYSHSHRNMTLQLLCLLTVLTTDFKSE